MCALHTDSIDAREKLPDHFAWTIKSVVRVCPRTADYIIYIIIFTCQFQTAEYLLFVISALVRGTSPTANREKALFSSLPRQNRQEKRLAHLVPVLK